MPELQHLAFFTCATAIQRQRLNPRATSHWFILEWDSQLTYSPFSWKSLFCCSTPSCTFGGGGGAPVTILRYHTIFSETFYLSYWKSSYGVTFPYPCYKPLIKSNVSLSLSWCCSPWTPCVSSQTWDLIAHVGHDFALLVPCSFCMIFDHTHCFYVFPFPRFTYG